MSNGNIWQGKQNAYCSLPCKNTLSTHYSYPALAKQGDNALGSICPSVCGWVFPCSPVWTLWPLAINYPQVWGKVKVRPLFSEEFVCVSLIMRLIEDVVDWEHSLFMANRFFFGSSDENLHHPPDDYWSTPSRVKDWLLPWVEVSITQGIVSHPCVNICPSWIWYSLIQRNITQIYHL